MNRIKVAVIGAGRMADEHIRAFTDISGVRVVGIHSRSLSRAKRLSEKYNVPNVYESVGSLYRETNADILVVAVSELSTRAVCVEAFKYRWLALIEKPVGLGIKEASEIRDIADKAKRKAFIALNREHYSATRAVLKGLEGSNGRRLVQVLDQENPQVAIDLGRHPDVVANWMYANSIHVIDYFRLLCRGSVAKVDNIVKWDPQNPEYVIAKLSFTSGDIGIYQGVWNAPGPWSVAVNTREAHWELRPLEEAVTVKSGTREKIVIQSDPWDKQYKPGFRRQAENAIKAVKGLPHSLPNLDDGIETMRLVQQIYAT